MVLRTQAAAEYVGLSKSALEKMRCSGMGPAFIKVGPRIVVYEKDTLDSWLNSGVAR